MALQLKHSMSDDSKNNQSLTKHNDFVSDFDSSSSDSAKKGNEIELSHFEGKYFSVSSWPDIPDSRDTIIETFSLSLRAKLLYGKHSFKSLVENGSFGNTQQIIQTLKACDELGVLIIESPQENSRVTELEKRREAKKRKVRTSGSSIYSKLLKWLN